MKYKDFEVELNYILDERLKENAKIILNNLPDYFYEVQAASTGKYHPKYALGNKGLVRHVKAAVNIAYNLFTIYKFEHPLLIGELLDKIKKELTLTEEEIKEIKNNVNSHMGKFNTNNYSDIVLPIPNTVTEKFVHMCDFLASRKQIHFEFDENNNVIE